MRPFRCSAALGLIVLVGAGSSARADRLVLVAGGGTPPVSPPSQGGDTGGVPATVAKLTGPFGADSDRTGNIYIVEHSGQRVCRVDPKGMLAAIAGTGKKGSGDGEGGPALKGEFNDPHSLALGADGSLYVADTNNNRVCKVDLGAGTIRNFAGTGAKGFAGDGGSAEKAQFNGIYCIAIDPSGARMIVTDLGNRRIRAIDMKTNVVTTVAGNGQRGVPADGATATEAPLVDPRAACADSQGNVYVLERSGNALRAVDAAGKIRTVVGTGAKGNSGDGGPAIKALMNGPKHLCIDRDGSVLIADTENHLIRRYSPKDGKIVRVAGTGKKGNGGLGAPPEQAELAQPHGVHVDRAGTLFISDSSNNRVLKVER